MSFQTKYVIGLAAFVLATHAMAAEITFYEGENFRGRALTETGKGIADLRGSALNDRASSVIVDSGNWEVCEDVRFGGRCVLLRPGAYDSLSRLRMNDRISSVRRVENRRAYDEHFVPEPYSGAMYEYRRRPGERVYEARVTDVRAVHRGDRCWVERDQVEDRRDDRNTGATVAGAIIGGILGHQVGKGGAAITAGGAVAGGAVGNRLARNRDEREDRDDLDGRDFRHCESRVSGRPDFWDVTYSFNGVEHRVQMDAPPGRTILVNGRGEPRQ